MNKIAQTAIGLLLAASLAAPGMAQTLSSKNEARVARAAPEDQAMVRACLTKKGKGKKTGTIAGGATGAGAAVIAGGSFGETVLAAGAGAVVGRVIGNEASTGRNCDEVLKRNP